MIRAGPRMPKVFITGSPKGSPIHLGTTRTAAVTTIKEE
jgi:hypothetical protein